jgi:integrase
LLWGAWYTGLRSGELFQLSWEDDAGICLDFSGKYPVIHFAAANQKNRKAQSVPLLPDAVAWFNQTYPPEKRHGKVFPVIRTASKTGYSPTDAGRVISSISRAARVFTNSDGKPAGMHDYRRAWITRLAKRYPRAVVQRLARHSSPFTTATFYVDLQTDEMGALLWEQNPKITTNLQHPANYEPEPLSQERL